MHTLGRERTDAIRSLKRMKKKQLEQVRPDTMVTITITALLAKLVCLVSSQSNLVKTTTSTLWLSLVWCHSTPCADSRQQKVSPRLARGACSVCKP
jgi:hypothetical protein